MNERYEIRERPASANARSLGMYTPQYVVWDLVEDKAVPFGNHRSRESAERHIARRLERENSG
jgi:hypothetical protein